MPVPPAGQPRPARVAIEQPHAEVALERADLLGQRLLREMQLSAARLKLSCAATATKYRR